MSSVLMISASWTAAALTLSRIVTSVSRLSAFIRIRFSAYPDVDATAVICCETSK